MKQLRMVILLGLVGLALVGCGFTQLESGWIAGSGFVTTEQRAVAAFTAVDLNGLGELVISQGDADALAITADDNLHALVTSEVRDETLYLSLKPNAKISNVSELTYTLTARDLAAVTVDGAANVTATDLNGPTLKVTHHGVGDVLLRGTVVEQFITLSGTGDYDGAYLVSETATITLNGLGNAVVNTSEELNVTIAGAGNVAYIGDPEVRRTTTGIGEVYRRAME